MYVTAEYGMGFAKDCKDIVKLKVDETRNRCDHKIGVKALQLALVGEYCGLDSIFELIHITPAMMPAKSIAEDKLTIIGYLKDFKNAPPEQ